jgi:alpha-L-fucosidase
MLPELTELVTEFSPHVLWADGDWETEPEYWGSRDFLAWLYNSSPVKDVVVTNDRWGIGTFMKHGDYFSGPDRFSPGVLQDHKWENAMTLDKRSWGYRRDMKLNVSTNLL